MVRCADLCRRVVGTDLRMYPKMFAAVSLLFLTTREICTINGAQIFIDNGANAYGFERVGC